MRIGLYISKFFLIIFSLLLFWKGGIVIIATSGSVNGSEFGMLISIANLIGFLFIWLSSLAFYFIFSRNNEKKTVTPKEQ